MDTAKAVAGTLYSPAAVRPAYLAVELAGPEVVEVDRSIPVQHRQDAGASSAPQAGKPSTPSPPRPPSRADGEIPGPVPALVASERDPAPAPAGCTAHAHHSTHTAAVAAVGRNA